jgi:hypothetical protein
MKVKELIKELELFNEELEVMRDERDNGSQIINKVVEAKTIIEGITYVLIE